MQEKEKVFLSPEMKFTFTHVHLIIRKKEMKKGASKSSNVKRRKPNDHFLSEALLLCGRPQLMIITIFHRKPADGA